jgi:hypothetical protein
MSQRQVEVAKRPTKPFFDHLPTIYLHFLGEPDSRFARKIRAHAIFAARDAL